MNNTGKILTALVVVATAGAIVGILFAPDKGSETRRKIKKQGSKVVDDVQYNFRKGKEKFKEVKEDIVETVKEKVEKFTFHRS